MSTLYCPRCDRRLTPDHRCLSRRVFLGMLGIGGAAVAIGQPGRPEPRASHFDPQDDEWTLHPGDRLGIRFTGTPARPFGHVILEDVGDGHQYVADVPLDGKPFYVVGSPARVVESRVLHAPQPGETFGSAAVQTVIERRPKDWRRA